MDAARAIGIGQDALIWLAGQPDDLSRFLATSGADPADLRARASEPEFLGSVLEFLLEADATVLDFAAHAGLRPEEPGRAHAALSGGALPNWT